MRTEYRIEMMSIHARHLHENIKFQRTENSLTEQDMNALTLQLTQLRGEIDLIEQQLAHTYQEQ
jgi:hypothetical protein